jgi:hypothetical protein
MAREILENKDKLLKESGKELIKPQLTIRPENEN